MSKNAKETVVSLDEVMENVSGSATSENKNLNVSWRKSGDNDERVKVVPFFPECDLNAQNFSLPNGTKKKCGAGIKTMVENFAAIGFTHTDALYLIASIKKGVKTFDLTQIGRK
jgi:hypothetical protein